MVPTGSWQWVFRHCCLFGHCWCMGASHSRVFVGGYWSIVAFLAIVDAWVHHIPGCSSEGIGVLWLFLAIVDACMRHIPQCSSEGIGVLWLFLAIVSAWMHHIPQCLSCVMLNCHKIVSALLITVLLHWHSPAVMNTKMAGDTTVTRHVSAAT